MTETLKTETKSEKQRLGIEELEFLNSRKTSKTIAVFKSALISFLGYYKKVHGEDSNLTNFLDDLDKNDVLPRREKRKLAEEELNNFMEFLTKKGLSSNSIRTYFATVQSFLLYKGFKVSGRDTKVPDAIPIEENEKHPWKLEEIKQFVDSANNIRDKAIILCLFQSGLSISDLCNLDFKDVREELESGTLPICLHLRRQKTGVEFKTFFGRDSVKYLRIYLETRQNLKSNSPLFTMSGSNTERLTIAAIEQKFSEFAKTLPFLNNHNNHKEDEEEDKEGKTKVYNSARPHSLRSAFRSRLYGKVDPKISEFWMGHEIGAESRAYLNMPEDELREMYASFEHLLSIEKTSKDELVEKKALVAGIVPLETLKEIQDLKTALNVIQRQLQEEKDLREKNINRFTEALEKVLSDNNELKQRISILEDEDGEINSKKTLIDSKEEN